MAIDEKSLNKIGRWPWPRSVMARLVDKLAQGGAKTIGLDVIFSEPEENQRLQTARYLKGRYERLDLPRDRLYRDIERMDPGGRL